MKEHTPNTIFFQASIDIESMYPSMPTDNKAINIIKIYIQKHKNSLELYGFKISHIIQMLEFVITHTYTRV